MRKSIVLVLSTLFLFSCAEKKSDKNFVLTGNIKGLKEGKLYIQRMKDTVLVAIDSIKNTDKFYILGSLNNCTDLSDTIIKNVEFTPTVSVNVDTFAICIGGSTTITANGGDRYVWSTSPTLEVIQNSITLRPTESTHGVLGKT